MSTEGTKKAAEAVLRELPSVVGAHVLEDVYGHPREIHLLVRHGPNPRHLAYDVRDLLEERLGIPIDQRVISIAQLAPGKDPAARRAAAEQSQEDAALATGEAEAEPRVRFLGVATDAMDGRARVRVRLQLGELVLNGDAAGVDSPAGRCRAAATAAMSAVNETCVGRARMEIEHTAVVEAFEREYVIASVLVSSPYLGRRPIALVGAQPLELDSESAAVLAALKAINRTLSLILRLSDGAQRRASVRSNRG